MMSLQEKALLLKEDFDNVHEAGKVAGIEADRREFWENLQEGGNRTYHMYTFYGEFWTDKTYNPIYPVKIRTNNTNAFYQCGATDSKVVIDIGAYGLNNCFRYAKFVTMKIKIVEGADPKSAFTNMSALKNLIVEGTIGKSFDISDSTNLTVESAKNILLSLKDYSTEAPYTYTVKFASSVVEKLEAEGPTSPNGNKWLEYLSDKGWNN